MINPKRGSATIIMMICVMLSTVLDVFLSLCRFSSSRLCNSLYCLSPICSIPGGRGFFFSSDGFVSLVMIIP